MIQGRRLVSSPFIVALAFVSLARCTPEHSDSKPPAIGIPLNPLIWCTGICNAGIVLEVRDARTGLPAAPGTRVEISDGVHNEVIQSDPRPSGASGDLEIAGAIGRPGTYDVSVRRPGYETFTAAGITVAPETTGRNVITQRISVNLQPR